MKDRILEFLRRENKSSAQFAEEIGVQPSGISHILSGRNNPSLDFILKMLGRYPYLSTDWLLFGKDEMYRDNKAPSLFDFPEVKESATSDDANSESLKKQAIGDLMSDNKPLPATATSPENPRTTRIVVFYDNSTFREYFPEEK